MNSYHQTKFIGLSCVKEEQRRKRFSDTCIGQIFFVKAIIILFFLCSTIAPNYAQGWMKKYEATQGAQTAVGVVATADNNYVIVGNKGFTGHQNAYLAKIDQDGNRVWEKNLIDEIKPLDIVQLASNDFLISALTAGSSTDTTRQYVLLKADETGETIWTKYYTDYYQENLVQILPTANEGILLGINTNKNYNTNSQGEVLEFNLKATILRQLDAEGNTLWQKEFILGNTKGIAQDAAGYTYLLTDKQLAKITPEGLLVWTNEHANDYNLGISTHAFKDLVLTPEQQIVLTGIEHTSGGDRCYIATITLEGTLLSVHYINNPKAYGFRNNNDFLPSQNRIHNSGDGHLLLTYNANPAGAFPNASQHLLDDIYFAKLTTNGTLIWEHLHGQLDREHVFDLALTNEGTYALIGNYNELDAPFSSGALMLKTGANGAVFTNKIQGRLVQDDDDNCVYDDSDIGLEELVIKAIGTNTSYYAISDADGQYEITTDTGHYQIVTQPIVSYWTACNEPSVYFSQALEDTTIHLVLDPIVNCPLMEVSIAAGHLTYCDLNIYYVQYANRGTQVAENATIDIVLDSMMVLVNASDVPLLAQEGNVYTFGIGDIDINESNHFKITVALDENCDETSLGQTHCVEAHIYPDTICTPPDDSWDGSDIRTSGICNGNTISFTISNIGIGDMNGNGTAVIIEDQIMLRIITFNLGAGQDTTVNVDVLADNYVILAEQSEGNPTAGDAVTVVEACFSSIYPQEGQSLWAQFPLLDANSFIDIECLQSVNSIQANSIQAFPQGFGDTNLLAPDTPIEYVINFQNISDSKIQNVIILDTLSPFLDRTSVRPGASSHPYTYELTYDGVLKFTFENINLESSTRENTAVPNFIRFKVSQKTNNPDGTSILHHAHIYMDNQPPLEPRGVQHTIGHLYEPTTSSHNTLIRPLSLHIHPNPFRESTTIELETEQHKLLILSVYNSLGLLVRVEKVFTSTVQFERQELPEGIYFFQLTSAATGQKIGTGKMMIQARN